jgi:hypothetical protein
VPVFLFQWLLNLTIERALGLEIRPPEDSWAVLSPFLLSFTTISDKRRTWPWSRVSTVSSTTRTILDIPVISLALIRKVVVEFYAY